MKKKNDEFNFVPMLSVNMTSYGNIGYNDYVAGFSLGGGLIVLASALSDASLELPRKYSLTSTAGMQMDDNGLPQYHYGWCLELSGLALILAEMAAVLTMSGYMARFSTVEEMVKLSIKIISP